MVCHDGGLATPQCSTRRNPRRTWDGGAAFSGATLLKWSYTRMQSSTTISTSSIPFNSVLFVVRVILCCPSSSNHVPCIQPPRKSTSKMRANNSFRGSIAAHHRRRRQPSRIIVTNLIVNTCCIVINLFLGCLVLFEGSCQNCRGGRLFRFCFH